MQNHPVLLKTITEARVNALIKEAQYAQAKQPTTVSQNKSSIALPIWLLKKARTT